MDPEEMVRRGDLGWIGGYLDTAEIITALNTLAEIVEQGHHADLSARQVEVAEKVYQRWMDS